MTDISDAQMGELHEIGETKRRPQHQVFMEGEGDNWYKRNKKVITRYPDDILQRYVLGLGVVGKRILEVGCSVGHRLERFSGEGAHCWGTDVSALAIEEGRRMYPELLLEVAPSHELSRFKDGQFDIVIASFVFHWIDRSKLMETVYQMDRVLKNGGELVVQDFFPMFPHKRAYHHNPALGVFTYKQPYWDIFLATNMYREVDRAPFVHDPPPWMERNNRLEGGDEQGIMVALCKDVEGNYPIRNVQ